MSRSGRVSAAAGNDLDIVLASRLARASTTDPYWKQRTNKLPADGKEVAKLKKQLSELSKDFHALLGVHEKSDASLQDVQGKIKLLRQELSSKDKQLDLCRRTVDRLTEEKAQNEGSIAADKAYIRKLENRLLSVKNAAELQSKCIEYRVQVEDMAHQLQLAESRAASAEEALQRQKQEQAYLKRGIELAAEQLTKSSGTEVPTTLLMAVARAQGDGMSMSVQLADSKQQLAQMASALQHARSHLLEQQKTLQKLQEQTQEHSHKLHSTLAELESEKVAGAELRHISASLKQHVSKLNKERDALRHQLELERTSTVAAEEKVQQLEAELMEQSQVEGSLRSQLRQLQAAAQQHKQQQHQTVVQRGPSGRRDVEQPKHERPTAPTPNRGSGAVRHATSMSTSQAGRSTERPIQRLRQQRQQHRRGLVSPEPAQPRALNGTGISRPTHAVFDVQLLGNEHIPTGNDMRGPGHAQTEHKPSYPLPTTAPHDGRQEGVHPTEKLTDLYVSALDQQIAMIEGDLAGLSASCSPTRLQEALQGLQRSAGGQGASGPHQREACRPQQCGDAGAGKRATKQGNSGAAAVGMAPPEVAGLCAAPPHAGGTKAGVPAGASKQRTPSKGPATRVHEPSPSKLLQPGWLAGQCSTPASPVIGAWRPNGTFEPTDTDVVVMQASMPEASAMLGSVDQVHNGSKPSGKMLRPSALIIPSTAHDRYGNELLSQSTPEKCLLSRQSGISSIRPSSTGSACPQGPAGQGPSPGLVWHSNPLAQATPDAATWPAPSAAPGNEHLSNTPVGNGAVPATDGPVARRPSSSQSSGNKVQPTSRWMDEEDAARSSLPLGAGNPPTVPSQGGCTPQEQPGSVPLSTDSCSRVGCAEPTLSSEVSWDWQRGPTPPPTQQRMQRSPDGEPCHHKQRGHQAAGASSWWAGEPNHPLLGSAQGRPTSPAWETHQLQQGAHDEGGDTSELQAVDCREGVSGDLQPQQQGNVPPRAVARPGSRAALGGSPGLVGGRLRWSVASGASSWLNTAYEPDIEQLEVKSHRKPARAQPRDSHKSLAEDKTEQYQQDAGGKQSGSAGDTPSGRPEPSLATLFELATMDLDCL